ncbi:unnamed protein product [Coregonus sp. 'balchen']|nr:unnamed protein product [Coregonus sp. 'balchen']
MDIIDPILGIAEKLYSLCGEVKANKKRCQRLAQRIKALEELVRAVKVKGLGQKLAPVENGLYELKLTLEYAQDVVKKYSCTSYLKRILKAYDQGDDFGSLNERLNDVAQVLSLALQVDQRNKLLLVFREATRRREDEADRESDRLELQKLLQSLAEDTKESVGAVREKVDSTEKDVKDIKAMLETYIREIKPEELIYDVPKEPFIKNDNSEIFKGEYNKFPVAIKRYTYSRSTSMSQVRSIFKKEVETMKRFESPNILRMFGICVQDESGPNPNFLIVMEFCEKGSLRESEEKFKVHGCINSSKFLVDTGYRVKLGGFELAKTETSLKRTKDSNRSSFCYSSPQQLENINHKYNKECEMYSFGIVLWEIATCKIPFRDCSDKEVYQRVCKDKYTEPLPEGCPKQLGELINDLLVDKLRKVVEKLEED